VTGGDPDSFVDSRSSIISNIMISGVNRHFAVYVSKFVTDFDISLMGVDWRVVSTPVSYKSVFSCIVTTQRHLEKPVSADPGTLRKQTLSCRV